MLFLFFEIAKIQSKSVCVGDMTVGKDVVHTDSAPRSLLHAPQAVKSGPFVFVSGLYATDFESGIPVRSNPQFPFVGKTNVELQTEYILDNLQKILQAAGTDLDQVVKAEVFLSEPGLLPWFEEVWRDRFPKDPPARTIIEVGDEHIIPGALVQVYAIAVVPDAQTQKEVISPPDFPELWEHCSPAVKAGPFLFHSGLPATDFKTGIPVGKDPKFPYYRSNGEDQAEYILSNMERCAQAAGTTLQNAVKSQHYHVDRNDFHDIDRVWKKYMNVPPPRSSMEIKGFMVPEALTTASLITLIPDEKHQKREVLYDEQFHPSMRGVYFSPAMEAGDWVFLAGQVASDFNEPVYGVHPDMPNYGVDISIQTDYVMNNLKELLEHCGAALDDVVQAHIYLLEPRRDYRGFERVWRQYIPENPPAMTVIPSTGIMFHGPLIEIDFIAKKG
jgi:enamine deaminase RidA (YjgF/YER057c/UK114 family)